MIREFELSNSAIRAAKTEIDAFLSGSQVDRREALQLDLMIEELLLAYRDRLGVGASCKVRCLKRPATLFIELLIPGEAYDPVAEQEEKNVILANILAREGLAPSWSYKRGRNRIVFLPRKKTVSQTRKMLVAIAVALVIGAVLSLLPDSIGAAASQYLLAPLSDMFMGLISAVSGPLIFLSMLSSISSMGDANTLGTIGRRSLARIFSLMAMATLVMTLLTLLIFPLQSGTGAMVDISALLELVYDIVPNNFFTPFTTGNTLQIIFVAIICGMAILMLSGKVATVVSLVEQANSIIATIMAEISSLLTVFVFVMLLNMMLNGSFMIVVKSYKIVLVVLMIAFVFLAMVVVYTSVRFKIPFKVLLKKIAPAFMIAMVTASSAAALPTSMETVHQKYGVEKKLVDFVMPIGQILYKVGYLSIFIGLEFGFAESYGIPITPVWVATGMIVNILIVVAMPPVPGGLLVGFGILFSQLGIPEQSLGVAAALAVLLDFPCTATHVTEMQLCSIGIANSLDMLDKDVLRSDI